MRWRRPVVAGLTGVLALGGVGAVGGVLGGDAARGAAVAQAAPPADLASGPADRAAPRDYVALGDSYTSAPVVPPVDVGAPPFCGRSAANYPHLLADELDLQLTDVSCGGATVHHLSRAQAQGVPPQLEALGPDTDLVTLGIGGNDNGLFATAIGGCASVALLALAGDPAPCRTQYEETFAEWVAEDEAHIRQALREIRTRSPRAQVLVVGYPRLLPGTTVGRAACLAAGVPFTLGDIAFLDELEQDLNAMLARAAGSEGATFVDTYTASAARHMCALPGTRWIEPLVPIAPAAPVHPNAAGQAGVADLVEELLDQPSRG